MRHAYHPMMEYIPVGLLEYKEVAEVQLMLFYFHLVEETLRRGADRGVRR